MSLLDGLLGQVTSHVDIQNLADKIGLDPAQVEQAVHALGVAHPQPGDTVETAAGETGLPADKLQEIVTHIGGEGSLAQFAQLLHGDAGEGIMGKLSGLFGRS